jgi:hypothetical protein
MLSVLLDLQLYKVLVWGLSLTTFEILGVQILPNLHKIPQNMQISKPSCTSSINALDISIGFSYEKSAGRRHRQCFLLDKSCRKCTQSFPWCYVNREKVTSFGHSARSAIYYKAGELHSANKWLLLIERLFATVDYV